MLAAILGCWLCIYQELRIGWIPGALAPTERGVRLRIHERLPPNRVADLRYDGRQWRHVIPADWKEAKQRPSARAGARQRCIRAIPYPPLTREQAVALRPHLRVGHTAEEAPEACVEANGTLWFGLGFYEGEGMDGVGGVGRYDPATKRLEVRRPLWLRDKSVNTIAYDGRYLWLGARRHYERYDEGDGLARYDWETDELTPMRGGEGPCGLFIGDLLVDRGSLWVSAEVLSRRDSASGRWTHFALSTDGSRLSAGASCAPWYAGVLDASRRAWRSSCQPLCDDEQVTEQVARADPELARAHLMNREELHWSEASALGRTLRTFDELRAALPKTREMQARRHLLGAFAATRNREPAWRDFVLEEIRRRDGDVQLLRWFRGDAVVFEFLQQRALDTGGERGEAIELLPWIDSGRARPLLLRLMRSLADLPSPSTAQIDALAEAIEAMERASHLRIEADGARTKLAADSDTPDYADEELGAFNRGRDLAELRRIVARWMKEL